MLRLRNIFLSFLYERSFRIRRSVIHILCALLTIIVICILQGCNFVTMVCNEESTEVVLMGEDVVIVVVVILGHILGLLISGLRSIKKSL